MLRIEDQIDNTTVMIKTADFIEMQLHKIKNDEGVAEEFVAIGNKALEEMRAAMKKAGVIR